MMTARALRTFLQEKGCHPDVVSKKRDGTFVIKRAYFYSHGQTSEKWGNQVGQSLPKGLKLVKARNNWQSWPKTSYFEAYVGEG